MSELDPLTRLLVATKAYYQAVNTLLVTQPGKMSERVADIKAIEPELLDAWNAAMKLESTSTRRTSE